MSLANLTSAIAAERAKAQAAHEERAELLDLLCAWFLHSDETARLWLRERAQAHVEEYVEMRQEVKRMREAARGVKVRLV